MLPFLSLRTVRAVLSQTGHVVAKAIPELAKLDEPVSSV